MISMKVAIADDSLEVCHQIRKYLTAYCAQEDIEMIPPDIYSNGESLFQAYLNGAHYDFLFLDIDFSTNGKIPDFSKKLSLQRLDCLDGITLGACLRNVFGLNDVEIIYMTSYSECAVDTIRVRPAAFMQKPVTLEKLIKTMNEVAHDRELSHRIFQFISNKVVNRIQVSRIQYLNSYGRQIVVQMVDDRMQFYGKLSEVMQQKCFESFICIHKSYIVNPDYIERYTATAIYLRGKNHEILPVSRTQQSFVNSRLLKG